MTPSGPEDQASVIFSLNGGEVWANRPDGRALAVLGRHDAVVAMMTDYIKQSEAAARLLEG